MKRLLPIVLIAELCSPLSAAIITERNDVFSSFPESAVFRGTSSAPGIDSQWIPYGTYTGGSGGTEYLRVTSNLVGVVASIFDGYWERHNICNGFTSIRDGVYGELWTNDTRRILDYINATKRSYVTGYQQDIWTNIYRWGCIEENLCSDIGSMPAEFGSRALDALAGKVDPPISTSWSDAIPFSAADADDWATVWPTYESVTTDTHFITDQRRWPSRYHISEFLYLGDFAGRDYSEVWYDFLYALSYRFVPVTIPEVLAYDTGLKYPNGSLTNDETDDFAHWRNMTSRLDWKRLGIICQLERQMETTYLPRYADKLPLVEEYAEAGNSYTGTLHVAYTIAQSPDLDTGDYPVTWEGSLSNVLWQYESSDIEVSTNFLGMCFPTAAAGHPSLTATSFDTSVIMGYFDIPVADLEDACKNYFTTAVPPELGAGNYNYGFYIFGTFSIDRTSASLVIQEGYIEASGRNHFKYEDDTFGFWQIENGSTNLNLRLRESKAAHATYTLSDALSARTNLVESLTRNDIFLWNNGWIAERTLPTYEMMISATNCADLVDFSPGYGWPVEMNWDDLAPSNGPRRVFRLSPEPTNANSRISLMDSRVAILQGLDREVKSQFASLAGQRVTTIASASAKITPSESAELRALIGAKHPPLRLVATTFQGAQDDSGYDDKIAYIVIYGRLDITAGNVEAATIDYVYDQKNVPIVNNAYRFGNWGLSIAEEKVGMRATNSPPVRVDGHQSQVLKTLWRFKNLRDPNL